MLRRAARERREFIYKKSVEQRQKAIEDKRDRLKHALDENHQIPTDLRKDALDLQKNSEWKDAGADGILSNVDNEYKWAGVQDPKIIVTTSHSPSSRLKQFAKEVKLLLPNSQRINRG
jgi:U3 small nucleolar ribonucleoprotein protein IMP4